MLTEVTGAPCSGKSTWLKKNNISAKSHSYFQKICIVFWVLRRFKRMEIELPVLIHILWKTENSFKVKVYVLINVIYKVGVYYRFKNANSDIVVDEGVVHIAYNIFLNQSDEFICRYIENVLTELLKSSHSIIHIDTSLVEIHSRLKIRGHRRLNDIKIFISSNDLVGKRIKHKLKSESRYRQVCG